MAYGYSPPFGTVGPNSITSVEVAAGAIGTSEVADLSLLTADIGDGQVTEPKLGANAVSNGKLAASALAPAGLHAARPPASSLTAGSFYFSTDASGGTLYRTDGSTWTQAASSVSAAGVADGSIGTTKLADDAVTTVKIANLQVTAAKIANDTITATQIAANAIGSSELADNAVDTAAIADSAVTMAKLAGSAGCGAGLDASKPLATAVPAGFLYLSTDISGGTLYRSNGTTWVQAGSSVSAAGVADGGISTVKLADAAVTALKLAYEAPQAFTASGSISATGTRDSTFIGASGQTITLPGATQGRKGTFRNIDPSDSVLLARTSTDTINNGLTSISVDPGMVVDYYCDSTGHWTINERQTTVAAAMYLANSGAPTSSANGTWQKVADGGGTDTWTSEKDVRPNGVSAQVDTATNKRIDIRVSGWYAVKASVHFSALSDAVQFACSVAVNGAAPRTPQSGKMGGAADQATQWMDEMYLAKGDYLELMSYQSDGTSEAYVVNSATANRLAVSRLGPDW